MATGRILYVSSPRFFKNTHPLKYIPLILEFTLLPAFKKKLKNLPSPAYFKVEATEAIPLISSASVE